MKRAAWLLLLSATGVVAAAAEIDRAARYNPTLAQFVPQPFASFALPHHALRALTHGTPADALTEARLLVQRRPIPAENISLLAAAQQRAGTEADSLNTLQIAARRGWRDQAAQEGMFHIALAANDHNEAASRLAALWGVDRDGARLARISATLLSTPQGREAFAGKLANGGKWRESFLTQGRTTLPAADFAETIRIAITDGAQFNCANLRFTADYLASKGMAAAFPETLADTCGK